MNQPILRLEADISRLLRLRSQRLAGRNAAVQGLEHLLRLAESFPVQPLDDPEFDMAATGSATLEAKFEGNLRDLNKEMKDLFQEWQALEQSRQECEAKKQQSESVIRGYRQNIGERQGLYVILALLVGLILLGAILFGYLKGLPFKL